MRGHAQERNAKEMTLEFGYVEIRSRHPVSVAEPSLKPIPKSQALHVPRP